MAMDILEAHTNVLPFFLLLNKVQHRAILRMATLPDTHPVHHQLKKVAQNVDIKRHWMALHQLLVAYRDVNPGQMEKVQAIRKSPKWKPGVQVRIAESKEKVKEMEGNVEAEVKIFTDGSGLEGKIGAAARLEKWGQTCMLKVHLRMSKRQTVYGGETAGLLLAVELLCMERQYFKRVVIGVDNQAAIWATQLGQPVPGH